MTWQDSAIRSNPYLYSQTPAQLAAQASAQSNSSVSISSVMQEVGRVISAAGIGLESVARGPAATIGRVLSAAGEMIGGTAIAWSEADGAKTISQIVGEFAAQAAGSMIGGLAALAVLGSASGSALFGGIVCSRWVWRPRTSARACRVVR
jgi:hypothetical protein